MNLLTPELIGLPAFLILTAFGLFVTALQREWLVLGREYREMRGQRDYWRIRVERGTQLAEKATAVAEKLAGPE